MSIDRKPRTLREVPIPTRMVDPCVCVNETASQIHVFINRDFGDSYAPRKVTIRPGQYFKFPHKNYNVYPGHAGTPGRPATCEVTMLKGKHMDIFLKREARHLREARSE